MANKKKKPAPKTLKKAVKTAVKKVAKKAKAIVAPAKAKPASKAKAAPTKAKLTAKVSLTGIFKPLDNRLLVTVEGPSERTAGGLYIPATVTGDRPTRGQVVAKGPGKRNKKGELRPLDVAVGDAVLFPEFAGTKITLDGRELLILTEDEVLAIADR